MRYRWAVFVILVTCIMPTVQAADDWLVEHPEIRVGVPSNLAPLISMQGNRAVGFDVDLLNKITSGVPIDLIWQPCGRWSDCVMALRNKDIDVLTSFSYEPSRAEFASFTQRYWSMPWALLRHTDGEPSNDDTDISQLTGLRIGTIEGYSVVPMLQHIERTDVRPFDDIDAGLDAFRRQQLDVYVDSLPVLVQALQQQPLLNTELSVLDGAPGEDLFIGVRNDYQPLVVLFNQGIEALTELDRQQLRRKWYGYELQRGWTDEQLLALSFKVGSVVVLIIVGVAIWNSRLRKEVKLRKAAERRIRYVATHDDLTGLPNRNLLADRLQQTVLNHQRQHKAFALMFMDLDGFKAINDEFGHQYGDSILVHAAQRMTSLLRKSDTVARYGGDEFVVLLPSTHNVDAALAVARKLVVHLARPYLIDEQTLEVSVSIGIAMFPQHGEDDNSLLRAADKAMYAAKAAGKNDVRIAHVDG